MKKSFLYSVCLGVLAMTSAAFAEPTIQKNVEYYDVKGIDPAFVVDEMNAKGPEDMNSGNRVWAHTRWRVKWNVDYNEQNTSCVMNNIRTSVTVDFVVPRWVDRDKAKPYMQKKWDAFYLALQKHEQQHAMHGVQAAREIEAALNTIGEKRLCSQIKKMAKPLADGIIKKYSDMDIVFDDKTDHGKNDGVHL